MSKYLSAFLFLLLFMVACDEVKKENEENKIPEPVVPVITYAVTKSYPHDTTSFTEGLLFYKGQLFESTGATAELSFTRSLFGNVDLSNGKINVKAEIDREKYFGEGITFLNGKVYQLTYKSKIGFIYDAVSFKQTGKFNIPSEEGWGMTTDGVNLIMSDGTNKLTWLDPNSLQVIKTLAVTENGFAKDHLNELEFIKGSVYANIWLTNTIVKIDVTNGSVTGILDLNSEANDAKRLFGGSLEMNGIAYDSVLNKVFVTGKLWPKIYELQLNNY